MAKDVDLSSDEWRDLVFEGKNKEFGAYVLRQKSPKRHNWAMVAVVVFIFAVFGASLLVSKLAEKEDDVKENKEQSQMAIYEEDVVEEDNIEDIMPLEMPEEIPVPVEEVVSQDKVTELIIKPDDQVTDPPKSQDALQESDKVASGQDIEGNSTDIIDGKVIDETPIEAPTPPPPPKEDDNKVFETVEQMPQYPGGDAALMKFISDNLRYPPIAQENGIQGRVTVMFVVTKNGSIGQVKVARGKDPELDKEAVRVVKLLKGFTPGKMNGHNVNVWYTLPITFRLQQ